MLKTSRSICEASCLTKRSSCAWLVQNNGKRTKESPYADRAPFAHLQKTAPVLGLEEAGDLGRATNIERRHAESSANEAHDGLGGHARSRIAMEIHQNRTRDSSQRVYGTRTGNLANHSPLPLPPPTTQPPFTGTGSKSIIDHSLLTVWCFVVIFPSSVTHSLPRTLSRRTILQSALQTPSSVHHLSTNYLILLSYSKLERPLPCIIQGNIQQ